MQKIFFTSDTHFNQQRTLELSRRPFNSLNEMNETMIKNWNKVVGKNDIVIHLGDFGDYRFREFLNGKIYLIFGNYEENDINSGNITMEDLVKFGFDAIYPECSHYLMLYSIVKGKIFNVAHRPTLLPKIINENQYNLYGHIHALQKVKRYGLNVGVDCNNFTPLSLDDVEFYTNAIKKFYDDDVFN